MSRTVMQRATARAQARDRIEAQIADASATFYRVLVGALLTRRLIFCYAYEPDQIEGRVETFGPIEGVYSAEFRGEGGEMFCARFGGDYGRIPALPVIGPTLDYAETDEGELAPVRALVDIAEYVNGDAEDRAFRLLSARLAAEFGVPLAHQKRTPGADVERHDGEPNLYAVEIHGPDGETYGGNYREGAEDLLPAILYTIAPGFDPIQIETREQRDAYRRRRMGDGTDANVHGSVVAAGILPKVANVGGAA